MTQWTPDQKAIWIAVQQRKAIEKVGGLTPELSQARKAHGFKGGSSVPVASPVKKKVYPVKSEEARAPSLHLLLAQYLAETPDVPYIAPDGTRLSPMDRKRIRFDALLETLYQKALSGDVGMMKLILDRVHPVHKTAEVSVNVSAGEHLAFLNRMRHGDTVLRFGNEPLLTNVIDVEPLIGGDPEEPEKSFRDSLSPLIGEAPPHA